jgi:dystonin
LIGTNKGAVSYEQFIAGFLTSKFSTCRPEMEKVTPMFDLNGDLVIEQKEFLDTLRSDQTPKSEDEIILNEVQKAVGRCTCLNRFKVYQVGEGKYRVSQFFVKFLL